MPAGKREQQKSQAKKASREVSAPSRAKVKPERSPVMESGSRDDFPLIDHEYDLISILYHALQGAETYLDYIEDAEVAGDEELAQFLRDVEVEEKERARRARDLLVARLSHSNGGSRRRRVHEEEEEFEIEPPV
jgi:hypothetical protein